MSEPLVSAIIVNYNGIAFVGECLRAVLNSQYGNFEVIFVDNGSTDGSLEYAKRTFGSDLRLKFVENRKSLGPAVGRNRGAAIAKGEYFLFLDNDTQIDKNCVQELINALQQDKTIGSAQAKLLRMNTDKLYDCAGDYLGPLGFLIERSRGAKDTGQLDFIANILSAKSAASIIRADLFRKIGGFDEDFYMYLEETDLSWRVWLAGLRVVFIPRAVVYHAFGTPKKSFKKYYPKYTVRYYGCRNYITTLVKNLELKSLVWFLPVHIFCWLTMATLFLLKGSISDWFYIAKGVFWNLFNIDILVKKHRFNNKNIRKVSDCAILKDVQSKEALGDYIRKIGSYLNLRL